MKPKYLIVMFLIFINTIYILPDYYYHNHFYPHHRFFPHFHTNIYIIETHNIFVENLGVLKLDKDLTADLQDIDSIDFEYGINANLDKTVDMTVYFTENGEYKIKNSITDFLGKSDLYDSNPEINNLKSFTTDNNELKLNFSNDNTFYKITDYETEHYYNYTLNYSLLIPLNESIVSNFGEMNSENFKNQIKKYIENRRRMNIAGISLFITGFGLMGTLNIASLVLYGVTRDYKLPIAIPGGLFLAAIGSGVISLSIGIPLWAGSYSKKHYKINFSDSIY